MIKKTNYIKISEYYFIHSLKLICQKFSFKQCRSAVLFKK